MTYSDIIINPIGIIHTPFKKIGDIVPIQGAFSADSEGTVELFSEYREGLQDLDGFSHIFLIYYFHESRFVMLKAKPYMDDTERGVFSIRSPHRPNHIGLTVVNLVGVEDCLLRVRGLDMIDGTPLIDIKPYNPYFDDRRDVTIGWMKRFFEDTDKPENVTVRSRKEWMHE